MKIILLHLGRKGAGPVFAIEMAKAITLEGHQVISFVSLYAENKLKWEESGLSVVYIKTYTTRIQFLLSLFCFKRFYHIIRRIHHEKPDVVYSPMGHLWDIFLFPFIGKITKIKTIHDVELHEGENSFFQRFFSKFRYQFADGFVVLSSKYVSELVYRNIPRNNIVVIPHAGFDYYLNNNISLENKKIVLFFGRIIKYKGLDVLLDAMKIIHQKDKTIKLRIVGNGDITHYKRKIDELGDSIELYNRWIDDAEVADFLYDVFLVVLPYTHASQSGVIPLAYSFSKPVVTTNVGCLSEQVVEGKTGFVIEPNDPNILAQKIILMFKQRDESIRMGLIANQFAKEELTWKASAVKLINFVNQLTEKNKIQ